MTENKKAALISVSNKEGLEDFAQALVECGYTLLASSGSGKALESWGIPYTPIEVYTGQPEILDGRVKTLHPKIHGGLLAKRDDPKHMKELEAQGIWPIDIAVINLYPFLEQAAQKESLPFAKMIELIDVGGPTMIRAAAKNHRFVLPVLDPNDYQEIRQALKSGEIPSPLRQRLAAKVFAFTGRYDSEIAKFLAPPNETSFPEGETISLQKAQDLRYGENPHQSAAFYQSQEAAAQPWSQLHGKALSYNNLLDVHASLRILGDFLGDDPTAIIIKHTNPCGVAIQSNLLSALREAKKCDPRSHFGGILSFNREVTLNVAEEIREDFAEVIIAPSFAPDALALLRKNKNLRLVQVDPSLPVALSHDREVRSIIGGYLIQQSDRTPSDLLTEMTVSSRVPSSNELLDLSLAWKITSHVKSNAIVIAKDRMIIGVGAGQMSRIDSVEIAISKAQSHGHSLAGAVASSDAFFPFPDSIETLAKAGVSAVVSPRGAKRDDESISTANSLGVSLLFTDERHFRH